MSIFSKALIKFGMCLQASMGAQVDSAQIERISRASSIDHRVTLTLVAVESAFDPKASSHANARGLVQLTSIGWKEAKLQCGVYYDVWDEYENVSAGSCLLNFYVQKAGGDLYKGLMTYNGGYRARNNFIKRGWKGLPPETRNYVKKFQRLWSKCNEKTVNDSIFVTDDNTGSSPACYYPNCYRFD